MTSIDNFHRSAPQTARRLFTTFRFSNCCVSSRSSPPSSTLCPRSIDGRDDYRILITAGSLVPRFSVVGQLASDGGIELVALDLDLDAGWEDNS